MPKLNDNVVEKPRMSWSGAELETERERELSRVERDGRGAARGRVVTYSYATPARSFKLNNFSTSFMQFFVCVCVQLPPTHSPLLLLCH